MSIIHSAPSLTNGVFDPNLALSQPLAVKFLTNAILKKRLAHAYLFSGRSAVTNLELARGLAAYLNCTEKVSIDSAQDELMPEQTSCALRHGGKEFVSALPLFCQNCRWILTDTHPQAFIRLDSEGSKSGKIAVEKTRLLTEELAKESQFIRVVYVPDADQEALHRPAANAILKTIEDPKSAVVFMLFAVRAEEVLPTIVSRCQVIPTRNEDAGSVSFIVPGTLSNQGVALSARTRKKNWEHDGLSEDDLDNVSALKNVIFKLNGMDKRHAGVIFLEVGKDLQQLISNDAPCEWLIDAVIEEEVDKFSQVAIGAPRVSKYLDKLIKLGEGTKLQIEHYVSPKAAIESFCLTWWQLKNEFASW